jgi:hypothetical protein
MCSGKRSCGSSAEGNPNAAKSAALATTVQHFFGQLLDRIRAPLASQSRGFLLRSDGPDEVEGGSAKSG